jgi:hypothetical protein
MTTSPHTELYDGRSRRQRPATIQKERYTLLPGIGYIYAGKVVLGVFVLLGLVTFGLGAIPAALIWLGGIIDGSMAVKRN